MGKARWVIQFAVSFTLALGAGVLIYQWMMMATRQAPTQVAVGQKPEVQVVVAAQSLKAGTKLTAEMVALRPYLVGSEPKGYFGDPESLVGRILIDGLAQNEPVLPSRLASDEVTVAGVSAIVTPGKRAIAVKGNKVLGLGGFIRPGARVDVAVTVADPSSEDERVITKTILENVRVLATGTELESDGEGRTSSVDIYTVELTPEESELIGLAATQGTLHFALRNPADGNQVRTAGFDIPAALRALSPPKPKPKPRRVIVRKTARTVEVIRGAEAEVIRIGNHAVAPKPMAAPKPKPEASGIDALGGLGLGGIK